MPPPAVGNEIGSGSENHASARPRSRGGTSTSTSAGVDVDLDDVRLGGGAGGDAHHARSPCARSASIDGVRQVDGARPGRSRAPAPRAARARRREYAKHDPAVVEERVARLAEHPLRVADVRAEVDDGLAPAVRRPPVEAPEAGAVAEEPERRRPAPTSAGRSTPARRRRPRPCARPPSSTTSRVASHGMSGWSHSSQQNAAPSGRQRGSDTKSGPSTTTSGVLGSWAASRTIVLVASRAVGVVLLLDAQQRGAVGVQVAVGVAQAARHRRLRRERQRATPPGSSRWSRCVAQSANHSTPSCTHQAPPPYSCTAVRALCVRRQHLVDGAVGATAQHRDPPALLGPALRPPHVVAVDAHAVGQARRRARPARS